MTPPTAPKPRPVLEGMTAAYYDYCARGELRFQRCEDCGTWRHPPRALCAACGSARWAWGRSTGRGRVFTWTVVHQAMSPAFAPEIPYAVIVVETDEGVRVVTNLRGAGPEVLRLDLPVEVTFEAVDDELTLPMFRPRDSAA
ncbi:MAG TPA: OB-fold domain-containing protein [Acidimicrobiia bacterium]|nr:OB-fold domain-containing protein [Acidimicrobiia bacterium]